MKRAVIQLGAGPVQRDLLTRIAASGLVPIVVDRSARPAGLVPRAIHVRAPIDDPSTIIRELKASLSNLAIGAVLTSTDLGVLSVPVVAKALALPHASIPSIRAMDDKEKARNILSRQDIRVAKGWLGRVQADIPPLSREREYVIKPVDSSGSRGVSRAKGQVSIKAAIDLALEFSDRFLVEEYVDGRHFDINGFVIDGRFHLVAIGRRFFTEAPNCVPIYGGITNEPNRDLVDRVTRTMQRSVAAFDYQHGPIKADLIEDEDGLVVVEMAARFHGDVFSYHVSVAAGLPPAALRWLGELGLCDAGSNSQQQSGWFAAFAEKPGVIKSIDGLADLRSLPGFKSWIPRLNVGERVGLPNDNRALVGFGLFTFPKDADVWPQIARYRRTVRVKTTD